MPRGLPANSMLIGVKIISKRLLHTNVIGALNLANVSKKYNIHMTNIGTGCIFEYDDKHLMNSGIGFTEDDAPNFEGSFYSKTKCMLEKLLSCYPNVLNLRIRMPISADLIHAIL